MENNRNRINPADKDFYILYTDGEVDFSKAPKAQIAIYPWGVEYTPKAFGQIIFKKDDGFYLRLESFEKDPHSRLTEKNDSVCTDSCMEFFASYDPENPNKYINVEMNSLGNYLCQCCDWIGERNIREKNFDFSPISPEVSAFRTKESWGVYLRVPLGMIYDVYGDLRIDKGSYILLNLYKCGNYKQIDHYGCWGNVTTSYPNYHMPPCFYAVEIK